MKQGWTYKTLGEIATSMYRGSGIRRDQVTTDGIPCVRYGEIYTTYNISFNECVSHTLESFVPNPKYFEHGDLLFAITGESVEDIGKTIAYMGKEKCMLGGDIICMKHNENPKFLSYALSTPDAIRQKGLGKTKLKVVHTNAPSLKSIKIPLPSPTEQERIVERLDAAFAQIDELKSNAERQLVEARALFQSALTQAMQPKPGWQEKKLVNVCDIFGRIGFRGYTTKDLVSSQNDGAISLSPSNIQNGEMDYSKRTYISWFKYNESPEIKIFNGDILLVKTGSSYGKSALVKDLPHEATINPQSVVLKNFRINNEFFAYQLRTERVKKEFDQFVSGTAIPTFSQAKLGTVPIYLPSEIEQEQIVSYLNSLNNHVRELEEICRKTAAECDAMKQALFRQIFE